MSEGDYPDDEQGVFCERCRRTILVPLEQMLAATYRMDAQGQITLASIPPAMVTHLKEFCLDA